jgi:hypothetical protein
MRIADNRLAFCNLFLFLAGCGSGQPPSPSPQPGQPPVVGPVGAQSDLEKVRAADVSILFVGNSHTTSHDLPDLVCRMIQFRHPEKTVYSHVVSVGFLEDTARDPACREEIESRPWKFVLLQAQKISVSGRHEYSRTEGIDLAKLARGRGAAVFFFSEWGLRDKPGDGPRQEKVYAEMARDAGVNLAGVGRAWDIALAERPDLPLYEADGNHQSATGAFLTAAYLCGKLTGESPAPLASFPYPGLSDVDRKLLAGAAARAVAQP